MRPRTGRAFLLLAALLPLAAAARPAQGPDTLVLALDGIGHDHALEAIRRGLLAGFRTPVPLVSSFPSLTGVGFTGMVLPLGYPPAPGYENRHFDWKLNKVWGGIPYIPFSWHHYFTLDHNSLFRKTLGYLWPRLTSVGDVQRVFDEVLASPRPFTAAYLANPDALAHMKGMSGAVGFLAQLEIRLAELRGRYRRRHGRELRVFILSDHGQTSIQQRPVRGFKAHLARGGFRLEGGIRDERSVVVARFGYVESGMLFCRDSVKAALARRLVQLDGIGLAVYAEAGAVVVLDAAGGEARVEAGTPVGAPGRAPLRYRPIHGDPLQHAAVVEALRAGGLLDAEGFGPAQAWLEQSVSSPFPDALYRLYDAFYGRAVENKASVIFAAKPGRAYGHPVTRGLSWLRSGRLEATHGGLGRDASLAMLLTDDPDLGLPVALRYDQVLPLLEQYRPQKQ